ncbi:MAG: DUF1080 domain-containing protein [Thermoguttaceae bacterium]|nr:DUF1080 domain-containing protein [Thermoguttaceae bacterium]MDW8078790.1 DUF1080 domain-containing protein [Thermoguttaceae bacterium]
MTRAPLAACITFAFIGAFAERNALAQERMVRLKLTRPDSFVGWDHGGSTTGWQIDNGKFVAEAPAALLLSGWTFGDFDLTLFWSVGPGGAAQLVLPEAPKGDQLHLVLSAGGQCGRLSFADKELAPGRDLGIRANRSNRLHVVRKGKKLEVGINDQRLYEAELPTDKRVGLGIQPQAGKVAFWGVEVAEPAGSPMFNGQDFSGWYTRGDIRRWRYEGGEVVLAGRAGDYLRTEKTYGNFLWCLEFKMQKGGNSGLGLRTPHEGWPTADGMELQLLDTPYDAQIEDQPMMAVYGHVPPLARADRSEQWNRVVVKAEGYMISAWVNGQLVQHVNTFHHPELRHRPLAGWLGFQDHGAWIRLRQVTLAELPEGLGLEAWYQPQPLSPLAEVLDRLINPERLALPTKLTSERVFAAVTAPVGSAPGEKQGGDDSASSNGSSESGGINSTVLADFAGPAALTGLTHFGGRCRLRLFFDGELQPRLEVTPDDWHIKLPTIGKDRNPLLTCLPFARRLRIEAVDAEPCRFYFDLVRFPSPEGVTTYQDIRTTFPRGWFEAVNAILRWLGSGRYQEFSPYERQVSEPLTLGPGERKKTLTIEGSGVVRSWKLQAPRRVLENNDLWVQIFTDGQKQPSVEAPVRFIFPGVTRNYENYVFADQRGFTLFLPMPFAKGWEMYLVNRGGRTLSGIIASATVDRKGPNAQVGEVGRLVGRFFPAATSGEIIRLSGQGRIVGLVYEVPIQGDGGIFSVLADGRPIDGWACDSVDGWVGRAGNFRALLSGREGPLCWRFFHLSPIQFRESLLVTSGNDLVGPRLVLYYSLK